MSASRSSLKTLLYIRVGRINARAVHANAPVKLIKRPNLGMIYASQLVNIMTTVRIMTFLRYGNESLNGFPVFVNKPDASVM